MCYALVTERECDGMPVWEGLTYVSGHQPFGPQGPPLVQGPRVGDRWSMLPTHMGSAERGELSSKYSSHLEPSVFIHRVLYRFDLPTILLSNLFSNSCLLKLYLSPQNRSDYIESFLWKWSRAASREHYSPIIYGLQFRGSLHKA